MTFTFDNVYIEETSTVCGPYEKVFFRCFHFPHFHLLSDLFGQSN